MIAHEFADFTVPHDGTQEPISERESELVAKKFDSLVDDLLLAYAGDVKHYSHGVASDSLLLKLPVDDQKFISISVREKTAPDQPSGHFPASERIRKQISLQKIVSGYGREIVSYRLFADGVVRRWDGGDMYAKLEQDRELGIDPKLASPDMNMRELADTVQQNLRELIEVSIPNDRLERQMGLQNQPIGMVELDGLADLVCQHEVAPRAI